MKAPVFGLSGTGGALSGQGVAGVFADDRRVLSVSEITLSGARLVPIASELNGADATRSVLVARGLGEDGADPAVWVERSRILVDGSGNGSDSDSGNDSGSRAVMREVVEIRSASRRRVQTTLSVTLGCDLAEISAVKSGYSRGALPAEAVHSGLRWLGRGADGPGRRSGDRSACARRRGREAGSAQLAGQAGARRERPLQYRGDALRSPTPRQCRAPRVTSVLGDLRVDSGDHRYRRFVERSLSDLRGLELRDPSAPEDHFLGAGAPWFLTLFGRDSLIAARMLLPLGTGARRRHAADAGPASGHEDRPGDRRAAGQDPARDPRAPADHDTVGDAGRPCAALDVLRHRRRHPAVDHAAARRLALGHARRRGGEAAGSAGAPRWSGCATTAWTTPAS